MPEAATSSKCTRKLERGDSGPERKQGKLESEAAGMALQVQDDRSGQPAGMGLVGNSPNVG